MKRRLLTIVMSVAMVFAFAQMIDGADDVHAAGNPYAPNATIKGQWANCTYWAWKLAYDNTGVELPKWGNAGTWYDSAHTAGYSVGTTPRARSIVVYTNSGVGHVAYVADYNSSTNQIYIKEGGYPRDKQWLSRNGLESCWITKRIYIFVRIRQIGS